MRPRSRATIAPAPHHRQLTRVAVLLAAGLIVYANGLKGPFVIDDHTAIVSNPQIRQILPLSAPLSPPRETPVAGRPIVNLTFAINYAMGGLDVRAYHVTNLAIHLLAALALFGVVRRTLDRFPAESPLNAQAHNVAVVSALIWLLHPLQTEVVNYTTQRTTSLAGLMLLLTIYCSVRALGRSGGRWQAAAVSSCAVGMACKESMAVAPLLVVMFDRVFVFASLREAITRRGRLYAGLAGTWIILLALMATVPRTTVGFGAGIDVWTYLLNQTTVIVDYLRLVLWPAALVLDYGVPQPLTLGDVLVPALVVTGLGAATLVALVRWPRVGFLGAWFFITLAPASSFVPIVTEVGAERRMYLPLAAIVVLAVCALFLALAARRISKAAAVTACAAVCVTLAVGTILRNREYHSSLSIAQTVVERRPHGRAYLRLGGLLIEAGRRPEAIDYFHRAKRANAMGARFALGTEYLIDGELDAGIRELTEFVQRHPDHINIVPARDMLGRAYLAQGRLDEAAEQFMQVLQEVPTHANAHVQMADILLRQNRPTEALPHLQYLAAIRASDVNTLGKLGTALAASGRMDEAITVFSQAAAVDPRHPRVRNMLGRALASQGRLREALGQFQQAVELAPGDEAARRDLEMAQQELSGES